MSISAIAVGAWFNQALSAYKDRTKVEQAKADAMNNLVMEVSNLRLTIRDGE